HIDEGKAVGSFIEAGRRQAEVSKKVFSEILRVDHTDPNILTGKGTPISDDVAAKAGNLVKFTPLQMEELAKLIKAWRIAFLKATYEKPDLPAYAITMGERRLALGYEKKTMADEMGVEEVSLLKWERGEEPPSRNIAKVAKFIFPYPVSG